MTSVATRHLQPLPLPVRPVPRETTNSYLGRLATANRLDSQALRTYLVGSSHKRRPIPVQRLAILSGQDQKALGNALSDLLGQRPDRAHLVRPACRLCAASCQAIGPVTVHLQPQELVCRNHNRWIGQSWSRRDTQPRLTDHPEITRANRHHRRIIRAHGTEAARDAYQVALWVCQRWQEQRRHQQLFQKLLARYHPQGTNLALPDPTVEASAYPQTIALTRILASPRWNELPFGTDQERTQFQDEVRRTVAPTFTWDVLRPISNIDPLIRTYLDEMTLREHSRPDDPAAPQPPPADQLPQIQ